MAGLGNILENPHVGLLFVDFVEAGVGLHVNGTAELIEDPLLHSNVPGLPVDPVPGRRSPLWVVARVETTTSSRPTTAVRGDAEKVAAAASGRPGPQRP